MALDKTQDPYTKGHSLALLGKLYSLEGHYREANEYFDQSLEEFQKTGDNIRQIEAKKYQADNMSELEMYEEMIIIQNQIIDHLPILWRGWVYWHRGRGKRYQGQLDVAKEDLELAEVEFNKIPFEIGILHVRIELAAILAQSGDLDEARRLAEQQVNAFKQIDHLSGVAYSSCVLARIYRNCGLISEAVSIAKEGVRIDEDIGNRRDRARNLHQLGLAEVAMGEQVKGVKHLEDSLAIFDQLGITPAVRRVEKDLKIHKQN
jgi:tetratricopeptide (TPR) repeat protein